MKTILFACTRNAGRSQLAASLFNALSSPAMVRAVSAGTHPAPSVEPEVVRALKEIGIEASGVHPQLLTPEVAGRADKLIALGCGEIPYLQTLPREDWELPDPSGQPVERVRQIRDHIQRRIWRLIAKEGWYKLRPIAIFRLGPRQEGFRRSPPPPDSVAGAR
jgi:protein-tyrosine-phosphatase